MRLYQAATAEHARRAVHEGFVGFRWHPLENPKGVEHGELPIENHLEVFESCAFHEEPPVDCVEDYYVSTDVPDGFAIERMVLHVLASPTASPASGQLGT